jgi:hypothetical protein
VPYRTIFADVEEREMGERKEVVVSRNNHLIMSLNLAL